MASMSQARTNGANTARPSAGAQRPQPATRLDSDDHVDDSLEVIVLDEGNTAGLGAEAPGGPRDVAQPALLSPSPATGRAAFVRGASTDGVVFTMAAPAPRCAVSSFAASPRASSGASLDVNSPTSADAADGTPRTPGAGAAPAAPFSSPGADSVEARLDAYVRSSLATSGGGDGVATRGTSATATGEPVVGAEASSSAVQSAHAPRPRSAHLNGVTQRRGKWEARLQVSGRVLYLGRYATRREAEIAFSSAAFKFRQSLLRDTTAGAAARAAAASAVDELEVARSGRVSIPVCTACGRAIDPSLPGGAIASWRGSGAGVAGSPPPRLASPSAPMPLPPTAACQCLLKAPLALPKALVSVSTAPRAFTRFTIVRFKSGRFSRSLPEFVLVDAVCVCGGVCQRLCRRLARISRCGCLVRPRSGHVCSPTPQGLAVTRCTYSMAGCWAMTLCQPPQVRRLLAARTIGVVPRPHVCVCVCVRVCGAMGADRSPTQCGECRERRQFRVQHEHLCRFKR